MNKMVIGIFPSMNSETDLRETLPGHEPYGSKASHCQLQALSKKLGAVYVPIAGRKVTRANILKYLKLVVSNPDRLVIVLFLGHGSFFTLHKSDKSLRYYMFDSSGNKQGDIDSYITSRDLQSVLLQAKAKVLFIIDSCHSGRAVQSPTVLPKARATGSDPKSMDFEAWSSCAEEEKTWWTERFGGMFFHYICNNWLKGKGKSYPQLLSKAKVDFGKWLSRQNHSSLTPQRVWSHSNNWFVNNLAN